jgi:hypothetical protein
MGKSLIKPSRRGLLHQKLGVPQDEKIPESKLRQALKSKSPALRKEAQFAENFGHPGDGVDLPSQHTSKHR